MMDFKLNKETNKISIPVPPGIRYMSEWEDFNLNIFDHAFIIDKKIPGCGFTEYCLTSEDDIILCSPRRILLENKENQHPDDVLYVKNELEFDPDVDVDLNKKISKVVSVGFSVFSISVEENQEDTEKETLRIKDKMKDDIVNYIHLRDQEGKPCKIIVTYDSFKYVKEVLQEEGLMKGFKIVVDEFQSIFVDSRFKASTEFEFFDQLKDFSGTSMRICFVSATPMIDKYLFRLDYFKNIPFFELDWSSKDPSRTIKPELKVRKMKSLTTEIKRIIQTYLDGKFAVLANPITGQIVQSREAVFYLNSVNDILRIIKNVGLTPDQVNILCSDTIQNQNRLKKKLGKKYQIGKVPLRGEPHKMFTFCTRTVYLGADFYSTNARTFILSDANIESLAVDISLDMPQILGRQRLIENPWKNHAEFYFKNLGAGSEVDKKIFDDRIKDKIDSTRELLNIYEEAKNDKGKGLLVNKYLIAIESTKYRDDYVSVNNLEGKKIPVFNNLVMIAEERAYDIQQVDYKDRFTVFNIIKNNNLRLDKIGEYIDYLRNPKNGTISERLKELSNTEEFSEDEKKLIAQQVSERFDKYYNIIGPERCKSLGYKITAINNEIDNLKVSDNDIKVMFMSKFKVGDKIPNSEAKEMIRNIYNNLGLKILPKSTDIENYFIVKRQKVKLEGNGEYVNGLVIVGIKK